jgi:hypothetical protein
MSSPEEKGKIMPGISFVVMPPATTDNVMNLDVLETEKLSYIPKPDGLSVSVPSPPIHLKNELFKVVVLSALAGLFISQYKYYIIQ